MQVRPCLRPFQWTIFALLFLVLGQQAYAWTPTHRLETPRGNLYLRPMGDGSLLFAFRAQPQAEAIESSPLWAPGVIEPFRGGSQVQDLELGRSLELDDEHSSLVCFMDPTRRTLALEIRTSQIEEALTQTYRFDFELGDRQTPKALKIRAPHVDRLFGLGEHFPPELLGQADGDLMGRVRYSGAYREAVEEDPMGVYGNAMVGLAGGAVGNALFPVLMLVDQQGPDAVLFLDNPADSRWDFRKTPWTVELRHGELQGAIAWGAEADLLRRQLMGWLGTPPVPPRQAFGLWVSEYGYRNWDEVRDKATSLKKSGFPIDGFVLDLQWFGGILEGSADSQMGSLTFDLENFPEPAATIKEFADQGLGIIVIEEAYIAGNLPEHQDLAERGFLVKAPDGESPHLIDENPWWGIGSMLDFTNREAARYWHQTKRQPLREMGVLGHWTDLGEPEMFRQLGPKRRGRPTYTTPLYAEDKEQLEANNLFAFRWAESIFEGFTEGTPSAKVRRPFILTRTGTAGIQRFGAALWSGDIGSNWESLRSHYRAQSHLALSGLDYFGSDVGGFHRNAFEDSPGGFDELYTRWFAAACLTDMPLRPHTMNLSQAYETAPDRVGDRASNLANLKQRYRLIPYLYTMAHRSFLTGQAFVAPPVLYQQGRDVLDLSGTHKWIGTDLFARLVLEPEQTEVDVHLPEGRWYDFENGELISAQGDHSVSLAAVRDGLLRTPILARGGAIIPVGSEMSSASDPGRVEVMIFPDETGAAGLLVEDDGWSEAYRDGVLSQTEFVLETWQGRQGRLIVGPRTGGRTETAPPRRDLVLHIASNQRTLSPKINDQDLAVQRRDGFWTIAVSDAPADRPVVIELR